jgi:membrane-associated phospholipid phosphatase
VTDFVKYLVGRLRPDFIARCIPDYSLVNNTMGYIMDNICTRNNTKIINDGRLRFGKWKIFNSSFPSGHASLSSSIMSFNIFYLEDVRVSFASFFIPFLQLLFFLTGTFIGISRYMDHHHHVTDVRVLFFYFPDFDWNAAWLCHFFSC